MLEEKKRERGLGRTRDIVNEEFMNSKNIHKNAKERQLTIKMTDSQTEILLL